MLRLFSHSVPKDIIPPELSVRIFFLVLIPYSQSLVLLLAFFSIEFDFSRPPSLFLINLVCALLACPKYISIGFIVSISTRALVLFHLFLNDFFFLQSKKKKLFISPTIFFSATIQKRAFFIQFF